MLAHDPTNLRRTLTGGRPAYLHCINTMNTTIQKWGNSLAVRIPQTVARQIGVGEGDAVQMEVEVKTLILRPAKPSYRLAEFVRRIRPENCHRETGWGAAAGKEAW